MVEAWLVANPVLGGLAAGFGLLLLAGIALQIAVLRRSGAASALSARLEQIASAEERTERTVREEVGKNREEATAGARHLREEIAASIKVMSDSLGQSAGQRATAQKEQLDSFSQQLLHLTSTNVEQLEGLRGVLDERLQQLQVENTKKLDEMRATVDEKLQGTLEKRLGEAFKQVSERLEAVHQGLGEMQNLANGVGDLKKVLTNVKTRGTWGEIALGELLDSVLTPEQYEKNVAIKRASQERVDFAIRLPGREDNEPVWLPIDAKFPTEDYHRLVEAEEKGELKMVELARKALEERVLGEARSIRDKYVSPPKTTDFAVLFLPSEGIYAELLRRPALVEKLQRDCRVVLAGPTTLGALLNSLQMGFRTLAIEKRSSEVRQLLSAVKTQFRGFNGLLEKVNDKLRQASNTIEDATRKSRYIENRLKKVGELPEGESRALLPGLEDPDDEDA
jgi:DNA recombination protein RmuC